MMASAVQSVITFLSLTLSHEIHVKRGRLGNKYRISDGKSYIIFRETVSDKNYNEDEVTLVIAFRLKYIGSNLYVHRIFQWLSLFNTPIWVGFTGFRIKFWMVEPHTKDYVGLYKYQGRINAATYAKYICTILKPLSTKGSVWSKIYNTKFEDYINKIQVR